MAAYRDLQSHAALIPSVLNQAIPFSILPASGGGDDKGY